VRLGAHLVFADESGFLLIPNVVKTWAPRGRTPVHRHRYRRHNISVISGISLSPRRRHLGLYYQLWFQNIGQQEVCEFLRHLLRHLRGPVIALLDNSRTHKGEPLHELQRQHPRLHIGHFPSYAPELNPDEGVWPLAKRRLANGRPDDLHELMDDLIRSIESIRRSPAKLRGCILQSELPLLLRCSLHYLCTYQDRAKLQEPCPNGVDVYFDNLGGLIMDAVSRLINVHARIAVRGQISQYNAETPEMGPRLLWMLIVKQARAEGSLVFQFAHRCQEGIQQMAQWLKEGKMKYRKNIENGIQRAAPEAFLGMLQGRNTSKQLVRVAV
jgi:transposase